MNFSLSSLQLRTLSHSPCFSASYASHFSSFLMERAHVSRSSHQVYYASPFNKNSMFILSQFSHFLSSPIKIESLVMERYRIYTEKTSVTSSNLKILNCMFNTITSVDKGGAVYADSLTEVLIGSNYFFNCETYESGGAIYVISDSMEHLYNCHSYCKAKYDFKKINWGNAVYLLQFEKHMSLYNSYSHCPGTQTGHSWDGTGLILKARADISLNNFSDVKSVNAGAHQLNTLLSCSYRFINIEKSTSFNGIILFSTLSGFVGHGVNLFNCNFGQYALKADAGSYFHLSSVCVYNISGPLYDTSNPRMTVGEVYDESSRFIFSNLHTGLCIGEVTPLIFPSDVFSAALGNRPVSNIFAAVYFQFLSS